MKYKVAFYAGSGIVAGYMTKKQFKVFKEQRHLSWFHIIDATKDDIKELFKGSYYMDNQASYVEGILVFESEYNFCMECLMNDIDSTYNYIEEKMDRIYKAFKFTEDESEIIKKDFFNIISMYDDIVNGDLDSDDYTNVREGIIKHLVYFGLKDDV